MNAIYRKLSNFIARQKLVVLSRKSVEECLAGYVVGVSDQWVLIHFLDEYYFLNGYSAIRLSDIRGCRELIDNDRIAERVLKLRGEGPAPQPLLSLVNLPDLLSSTGKVYPLLTIHRERINPEVCFIGRVQQVTDKTVTLNEIDPSARWTRTRRYRLDDITRIDIGGLYEDALLLSSNSRLGQQSQRAQSGKAAKSKYTRE